MPKKVTPLTDSKIKTSKSIEKDYTLADGDGLHLLVKKIGSKLWEFVYISPTRAKRRKTSLGAYPDVTLVQARKIRTDYRELVANGIDPMDEVKKDKEIKKIELVGQFHLVVKDWIKTLEIKDISKRTKLRNFTRDIFPYFANYDSEHNLTSSTHISEIEHDKLLYVLKEKAKETQESASRLLGDCRDENILAEMLRAIEDYNGQPITRHMLKFLTIIPLRAENLTRLTWDMIDFKNKILTIPRANMKIKDSNLPDFVLPLPHQAIEILDNTKLLTGWG